jgi:sugar transferase (PEP-CTERM/EpsH1 system associated)
MKPAILFLAHRLPYPPNKGDKIRSFHWLQALASDYRIFLGAFIDEADDLRYTKTLARYCEDSCFIRLHPWQARLASLQGLWQGQALSLPYYRNRPLQQWVDTLLDSQRIDAALLFSSPMAQYLQAHRQLPWVADLVDVDSEKWRQRADSAPWWQAWLYRREADCLRRTEQQIAEQAGATLLVSAAEAALFTSLVPDAPHVHAIANGVDSVFFDPALAYGNPFADNEKAVVFTGRMDYWPNGDAVQWFVQQSWPLIRQQQPTARFYIVGAHPSAAVQSLADHAGVTVTGRVDDVRPYLAHAQVVVAPLRLARGIQNKVLEAMAMAKPLVLTHAALEGISLPAGVAVTVADSAHAFAEAVLQQLNQSANAATNRAFVEQQHSWQDSGRQLCTLLARVIAHD